MIRYLIAICLTAFSLTAFSLNDPWSVNVNDHAAVQRTYKQGESWTMQVSVRDGLKPLDLTGATAKFYWYTNTVQNIWWTNSAAIPAPKAGLVTAQWTPAMDCGAASYPYWFGIWMPGSTSPLWRVTGTIRMLTSPGFKPNEQQPPVRTLDFAAITITNAPWVTAADWASGSNALASALQAHVERNDNPHSVTAQQLGAATPSTVTSVVESAIAALPPPSMDAYRLINPTATQWIDGTGGVWRVSSVTSSVTRAFIVVPPSPVSDIGVTLGDVWAYSRYDYGGPETNFVFSSMNGHSEELICFTGKFWSDPYWMINPTALYQLAPYGTNALALIDGANHVYLTETNLVTFGTVTQRVDQVAMSSDLAAIPTYPTNYIAGFVLPIPGTNVLYTLSVDSNRTLSVWEVVP